jgi:beta-fructofuranosidase
MKIGIMPQYPMSFAPELYMRHFYRTLGLRFIALLAVAFSSVAHGAPRTTQTTQRTPPPMDNALTLASAERSLQRGAELAVQDVERPRYHFMPPGRWVNDPNGPLLHNGWYHMFYQLNPFWDIHSGGVCCWGHARSKDMVNWEHMPIALFPSLDKGENHCYSGTCMIDDHGRPIILYTSVHSSEYDDAEQWAATGDAEMRHWEKLPGNPVMTQAPHGNDVIRHWRDPMSFKHEGHTYVVIGGSHWKDSEPRGAVLLYRATNAELTAWEYLGIVYEFPDPRQYLNEVPNLFPLGDKWVLITNPLDQKCMIGSMDFKTFKFTPEYEACPTSGDFNIRVAQLDPDPGRVILWGFIAGFQNQRQESRGWSNCMTLPRVLTLRPDKKMGVAPLPALDGLRGPALASENDLVVTSGTHTIAGVHGDGLEIQVSLLPQASPICGIKLRCSADQSRSISIQLEEPTQWNKGPHLVIVGNGLRCTPGKIPFMPAPGEKSVDLRIYLDQSVLEVFVNGRASYTGVMEFRPGEDGVSLFAQGGSLKVPALRVWPMAPSRNTH